MTEILENYDVISIKPKIIEVMAPITDWVIVG